MNLNFQNKTIEKIEVDCDTVEDLVIKLTKSKFSIAFKSQGKVIKKEIKNKDEVVDLVMEVEEPVVVEQEIKGDPDTEKIEVAVEEPVVMEEQVVPEQETVVMEDAPVTLEVMKELLQQHIPKKNTLAAYVRTIQQVYTHFKITDMNDLFRTREQEIIEYIETKYANNSTIKSKLCSVYKAYKVLNIESQAFKNKIDFYASKQTLLQEQTKEDNKKTVEEGNNIIEHFKTHMEDLGEVIQNDTSENDNEMINNWDINIQLYCLLKIYLTYGVIRSSELIDCKIVDTEIEDDKCNYINVNTKQIVIHIHKNDKSGVKIIDISADKKLLGILRKGVGNYLITNKNGGLYESSSSFAKVFRQHFNCCVYDLRKAVSSKCIASGDVAQIKKLEHVQGHDLKVILNHYNEYSKKE